MECGISKELIMTDEPTEKHAGGRPRKYETPELMQVLIDAYFKECAENSLHPTVTGLAMLLDMDRRSLINYEQRDEFLPTIKRAKQRVEECLEQNLHGQAVAGTIFNLKNNFGWKDQTETKNTNTHGVTKDFAVLLEKIDGKSRTVG